MKLGLHRVIQNAKMRGPSTFDFDQFGSESVSVSEQHACVKSFDTLFIRCGIFDIFQ